MSASERRESRLADIAALNDILWYRQWSLSRWQNVFMTHRNEKVRDSFLIARPGFAVLSAAPGDISRGAMDDHNHEEDEVEPGERAPSGRLLVTASHCKRSDR